MKLDAALSHWCIYHRKRARQIVKTWEKEFFAAPKEKRVSFLYLANDIIQNSRKKGSEFVSEFWKVLNNALKDVKENGDENGRNAVSRLVNIWEERKVFGTRAQTLKETFLGNNPVPDFEQQEKQDEKKESVKEKEPEKPVPSSPSIQIKLDGGVLEKLVKAFKEVSENLSSEEATIEECNSTKRRIEMLAHGDQTSSDELQQEEVNLRHLVEQLEAKEKTRQDLVMHLREALFEQETKLENLRSQIQAIRSSSDHKEPVDEGSRKPSTAAEFAAKLAASTSSAAMLSSILSSLTAEESAALGLHSDKRPRLEKTSEGMVYAEAPQYRMPPPVSMLPQQPQFTGMGLVYQPPPPPPPPPPPGRPTGLQMTHQEMNPHLAQQQMNQQQMNLAQQQMNSQLSQQQMNPQHLQQLGLTQQQMNPQMNPLTQQQQHLMNPQLQQMVQASQIPPGCAPSTYSLPPYYPSAPTQVPR